ncbi:MAG: CBU_0592 family membrane protein [Blastocatellia bacterium]
MHGDFPTIVGSIGVGLLLLAYFLNLIKRLTQDSKLYTTLNIIGAGLACYSSYLISFIPFIILEGVWFVVSLVALINLLKPDRSQAA